jgi:hypothetical protein
VEEVNRVEGMGLLEIYAIVQEFKAAVAQDVPECKSQQ